MTAHESGEHRLGVLLQQQAAPADLGEREPQTRDDDDVAEAIRRTTESVAMLDVLQKTAPFGFAFLDTDLRYVYVNEAMAALTGLPVDEHPGRRVRDVLPALAPVFEPKLREVLASGEPLRNWDVTINNPVDPTERRSYLISYYPVRTPKGKVFGVGGVVVDVTERKRDEEQRRRLLDRERMARIEAEAALLEQLRAEWISIIAHDLRQPVTVIAGYADLLRHELSRRSSANPQGRYVEHIVAAGAQLSKMIGDLLDVSRIESRRVKIIPRTIDLAALVGEAVERAKAVTSGHVVRVLATGSVPRVRVDPERIEQVLGNLLSNAAKYSYPNTAINVEIRPRDGQVEVSVTNQGGGIAPDELSMLFNRFHRTRWAVEEQIAGLGLGLYITKGLIEAHGGRIAVASIPNQTTSFCFTLPIRETDLLVP